MSHFTGINCQSSDGDMVEGHTVASIDLLPIASPVKRGPPIRYLISDVVHRGFSSMVCVCSATPQTSPWKDSWPVQPTAMGDAHTNQSNYPKFSPKMDIQTPPRSLNNPSVDASSSTRCSGSFQEMFHDGIREFDMQAVSNYPPENVVIKILHKDHLTNSDELSRRNSEVSILTMLDHPNITKLLGHFDTDHESCMFFDYANLGDLHSLTRHKTLSEANTRRLCLDLLNSLAYVHSQGIIHCDVKPQNVLLFTEPANNVAERPTKLLPFPVLYPDRVPSDISCATSEVSFSSDSLSQAHEVAAQGFKIRRCLSWREAKERRSEPRHRSRIYKSEDPTIDSSAEELQPGKAQSLCFRQLHRLCLDQMSSWKPVVRKSVDGETRYSDMSYESSVPEDGSPRSRGTLSLDEINWERVVGKLCDFGLAQKVAASGKVQFSGVRGTMGFIAPEIIKHEDYDFKADIWAVGVMCYTLMAGYEPFFPSSSCLNEPLVFHGRYWDRVSPLARNFISKLLAIDPNLRPSAIEALHHPWLQD